MSPKRSVAIIRGLYLGIDPGTHCGWALLDETGKRIASGTFDLSSKRHEGGGMRYLRARRAFREIMTEHNVVAVGYEEVARHRGVAAAHVYGGVVAQLTAECEEQGIPYAGVPVGTAKKRATGNGGCGKPAMILAARLQWPDAEHLDPSNDKKWSDEADALWIGECVRETVAA